MMGRIGAGIPARNEAATVAEVVQSVRAALPGADVVVVDDASVDDTARLAAEAGALVLRHCSRLGYSEAVATVLLWALRADVDTLVLLDADGQHAPRDAPALVEQLERTGASVVIGSRQTGRAGAPRSLSRRIGNDMFSGVVRLLAGLDVEDTTSGFKALSRPVFCPLLESHFVDFHAESIVFLQTAGFRIEECAVTMVERHAGRSMHGWTSPFVYPLKTAVMAALGLGQGRRRAKKGNL